MCDVIKIRGKWGGKPLKKKWIYTHFMASPMTLSSTSFMSLNSKTQRGWENWTVYYTCPHSFKETYSLEVIEILSFRHYLKEIQFYCL